MDCVNKVIITYGENDSVGKKMLRDSLQERQDRWCHSEAHCDCGANADDPECRHLQGLPRVNSMIRGFVVRGLFSVWLTRGPETLVAELNKDSRVHFDVSDHGTWPNNFGNEPWLLEQSIKIKKAGDKLVLIGHSFGGTAVINVNNSLAAKGLDVDLLVPIDPAGQYSCAVRPNAKRIIGFFQKEFGQLGQGVDTPTRGWTPQEWRERCVQYQRYESHIAIVSDPWVHQKIKAAVSNLANEGPYS